MATPNLFTRDDTFLGVCQGLGEDLGFPPDLLRVALAVALFWNPLAVVAIYLGLGVVVAGSRLAFPARATKVEVATEAPAMIEARNDEEEALPLAA